MTSGPPRGASTTWRTNAQIVSQFDFSLSASLKSIALFSFATVPTNCEYVDQPGTYLPFTDTYVQSVLDIEECRSQCSAQGQYNCRSFNYNAFRKECFLSSDDSVSLPDQLQTDRDFTFSERAGCNSGTDDRRSGLKGETAKSRMSTAETRTQIICNLIDNVGHLLVAVSFSAS